MPVSTRAAFGIHSQFLQVSANVAGVNTVLSDVGVAILISGQSVRLTKLGWRVDIAPDVPTGTVSGPTRYRVVVLNGQLPVSVTAFQQQQFPGVPGQPSIPKAYPSAAPIEILHDEWLDFGAGSPGLNVIFTREFVDAGPTVLASSFMTILLIPILDAQISQAIIGPSNAQLTLLAHGCGITGAAFGGSPASAVPTQPSLPRYDNPRGA